MEGIRVEGFSSEHYFAEHKEKNQIVIHHTVSSPNSIEGDVATWMKLNRIATHVIISADGTRRRFFNDEYWAWHLGVKTKNNKSLNEHSLSVELDSWGAVEPYHIKGEMKFKSAYGHTIRPRPDTICYFSEHHGHHYFQRYTDEAIKSLKELLQIWGGEHNIPLDYNEDMWDVSERALNGESGIWGHCSFRADKSDCHPQPELIQMLKSLSDDS